MKKIIFIQGPQGSGKSSIARALVEIGFAQFFNTSIRNSRKDKNPVDCIESLTNVTSYIECNAKGELVTLAKRSQPTKANLHIIEAFTLYPEELVYVKQCCEAGIQFVFTSQLSPPKELRNYIIHLKIQK